LIARTDRNTMEASHSRGLVMRIPRFSIARLMGCVLAVALGLAVLRYASQTSASIVYLVTCSALFLSTVGALCASGVDRTWWIGFAVFGWGYMSLVFGFFLPTTYDVPRLRPSLPMSQLLRGLYKMIGPRGGVAAARGFDEVEPLLQVGECLVALIWAVIGATTARALFGAATIPAATVAATESDQSSRRRLRKSVAIGLGCGMTIALLGAIAIINGSEEWSDVIFLLTCALLGFAVLGAAQGRGRSRARWLGAALFGWGYLWLALGTRNFHDLYGAAALPGLLTTSIMKGASARVPFLRGTLAEPSHRDPENAAILKALAQPFPARFARETSLDDVFSALRTATKSPALPHGLPFYVDPIVLAEVEKTMASPIVLDLEPGAVRINAGLELLLSQLGLGYFVKGGVVRIVKSYEVAKLSMSYDPFQRVGHSLFALVSACIGCAASCLADGRFRPRDRRRPPGRVVASHLTPGASARD
jgi:hypothetical protein